MKYIGKRIVSNHQIGVIEFASVDIRAVFTNPDESANDLVFQLLVQKLAKVFEDTFSESEVSDLDDIESYADQPIYFKLSNGRMITIGSVDAGFLAKLRRLSAGDKIRLMDISLSELISYQENLIKDESAKALFYFSQKWIERMDGGVWDFADPDTNEDIFHLRLTKSQIISKIKKNKLTPQQLQTIIEWFESGRDVKSADEENPLP